MGVVFKGKFIWFSSPRTGSNAIQQALLGRYPGNPSPVWEDSFKIGQHMSRPEMINKYSFYADLPGVCGIRNPFDVLAAWFHAFKSHKSIRHMIHNNTDESFIKGGRVLYHVPYCQFLIRYEKDMMPRLNDILNHFKLPPVSQVPVVNVSQDRPPYQSVYTQKDIDCVRKFFQPELDELGYYFEGEPLG